MSDWLRTPIGRPPSLMTGAALIPRSLKNAAARGTLAV
jgi:hypothetical protein